MNSNLTRLPILILTGFLGSGKTTLLNRLLRDWPSSAVLINEFGEAPVDPQLIEQEGIPLMTLSGGCLCCQVRGALAPVLRNIRLGWGKPGAPKFDRVILETSGVASPEPVLDTLLRDRWLARNYQLLGVVATLAVPSAAEHIERFPEAMAQVAWADALVLTQADLADTATLARLETRLDALAPATPRLRAVRGELDPAALLTRIDTRYRRVPDDTDRPDHGFRSVSVHFETPVPWVRLRMFLEDLLARHPSLVRVKGVVQLPNVFSPVAVHGAAGRLYPPVDLSTRAADDARSRLVFITTGPVTALADEVRAGLAGNLAEDAVRWH
ncbi:CobW family GTP-binding protein [Methylomagnum sp.]